MQQVDKLITEIAEASKGQVESISQASLAIEQIAEVVQMNAATAEEGAATSQQLSGQSNMMNTMIEQFKL